MFETIIDARKGTVAVNRIYKGNTLVWSRYNWEKWSCETRVGGGGLSTRSTGATWRVGVANEFDSSNFSMAYRESGTSITFYNSAAHLGTVALEEIYDNYYRYFATGSYKVGDTFQYLHSKSGGMITFETYEVYEQEAYTTYSKGSTNYGIVTGNQGDYPSNGRHSDGYWYVSVGAMGFEEEEGNR